MTAVAQRYDSYAPQEHAVWAMLKKQQTPLVFAHAAPEVLLGHRALKLPEDAIPRLDDLSIALEQATGWRIAVVDGMVDELPMVEHLSRREFPVSRDMRPPEKGGYSEKPDLFHDVFGHLPTLFNPTIARYLETFGRLGLKAHARGMLDGVMSLYFYTMEFGLIKTPGGLRIFGSALASSKDELEAALGPSAVRVPFCPREVLNTPVHNGSKQPKYFVIESFQQLEDAIHLPALLN